MICFLLAALANGIVLFGFIYFFYLKNRESIKLSKPKSKMALEIYNNEKLSILGLVCLLILSGVLPLVDQVEELNLIQNSSFYIIMIGIVGIYLNILIYVKNNG